MNTLQKLIKAAKQAESLIDENFGIHDTSATNILRDLREAISLAEKEDKALSGGKRGCSAV